MSKTWTCPHHSGEFEQGVECPQCVEWYATRPDPATMTPEARLAELDRMDILTVKFEKVHKRIEELCGCAVWTHQMADRHFIRELARRRNGDDNSAELAIEQLVDRVGKERVIVVEAANE